MYCPDNITPEIERLRDAIVPGSPLHYIDIEPISGALENHCHMTVARHVRRVGGAVVFGWKVWLGRGYVEAEFHSVWRDPEGVLRDISPDADGESRILFFVDDARRYKALAPEPNRVLVLTDEGRALLAAHNAMNDGNTRPPVIFLPTSTTEPKEEPATPDARSHHHYLARAMLRRARTDSDLRNASHIVIAESEDGSVDYAVADQKRMTAIAKTSDMSPLLPLIAAPIPAEAKRVLILSQLGSAVMTVGEDRR